jgi:hypothetical protein
VSEAQEHPNPRIRKLDKDLTDLGRRADALDDWSSATSSRGAGKTAAERATYHAARGQIVNEKLAALKEVQRTDPSFRPGDVAEGIRQTEYEKRQHNY